MHQVTTKRILSNSVNGDVYIRAPVYYEVQHWAEHECAYSAGAAAAAAAAAVSHKTINLMHRINEWQILLLLQLRC